MKSLIFAFLVLISCTNSNPITELPPAALKQKVLKTDGQQTSIKDILEQHKGKTIVIDIWASWCKDCLKGMPKVKALMQDSAAKEVAFVFLSMDKSKEAWLNGLARFNLTGAHYYMGNDWENEFNTAIDLDWIPRYMVIGKDGKIKVYKAIKADDKALLNAIKDDN